MKKKKGKIKWYTIKAKKGVYLHIGLSKVKKPKLEVYKSLHRLLKRKKKH